ncbi:MAG: FAD-dependent oxidoreductase [Verrucomicrobiota bacterium]
MPRKIRCTVESITDHGGRVYTVDLAPQSVVPGFKPGQFLHLTVDDYDPSGFWPESRVFSIASSPRDRGRIRICYAVKGRYTTKMEQTLKVGGEVWIKMPYGEFVIDEAGDAILIAGGTGISAFTAFLETLKPENPRQVWLVYGARSPDLLLFREMIMDQLRKVPGFHALFFAETGGAVFSSQMAALPKAPESLSGRVSLDQAWSRVPAPAQKVFYLSGPPVMLNTLMADLKLRGVPPEQIRTDAWE